MAQERFSRTARLLGDAAIEKLQSTHILLFGVGGVGGYVLEALVRAGVGEITVVDADTVSESNLNRQILATTETVGQAKTAAAAARARAINPDVRVHEIFSFVEEGSAEAMIRGVAPDYIVDAIDTVSAKVGIIRAAKAQGIPIISSMGTGNKLDPTKLTVTDISKTSICPLARAMRTRLRREGIAHLDVLFSTELPLTPLESEEQNGRHLPASTPFVPAAAGLVIAAHVTRKILQI